jgi:hypothetical protein
MGKFFAFFKFFYSTKNDILLDSAHLYASIDIEFVGISRFWTEIRAFKNRTTIKLKQLQRGVTLSKSIQAH